MSDSQFFERFEETAAVCEYLNDLFYEMEYRIWTKCFKLIVWKLILLILYHFQKVINIEYSFEFYTERVSEKYELCFKCHEFTSRLNLLLEHTVNLFYAAIFEIFNICMYFITAPFLKICYH